MAFGRKLTVGARLNNCPNGLCAAVSKIAETFRRAHGVTRDRNAPARGAASRAASRLETPRRLAHGSRVSTLQEIEAAIEKLSPGEFLTLVDRLRAKHPDAWERQIEQDSRAGALDFLVRELDEDIAQGRARPIDEQRGEP